jgi:hypothetical protein
MMWRTPPEPSVALMLHPGAIADRLTERSHDRKRLRLVGGLRSERAIPARPQLLRLAAQT